MSGKLRSGRPRRRRSTDPDFGERYGHKQKWADDRNPRLGPRDKVLMARIVWGVLLLSLPLSLAGCVTGLIAWSRDGTADAEYDDWYPAYGAVADDAATRFIGMRHGSPVGNRVQTLNQALQLRSAHIGPPVTEGIDADLLIDMVGVSLDWERYVYVLHNASGDTELLSFGVTGSGGVTWPTHWPARLGGFGSELLSHQDAIKAAAGNEPNRIAQFLTAAESEQSRVLADDPSRAEPVDHASVAYEAMPEATPLLGLWEMPSHCDEIRVGALERPHPSDGALLRIEEFLRVYVSRDEAQIIELASAGDVGVWPMYPRTGYSYVEHAPDGTAERSGSMRVFCTRDDYYDENTDRTRNVTQVWFLTESDDRLGPDGVLVEMRDLIVEDADGFLRVYGAGPYMSGGSTL